MDQAPPPALCELDTYIIIGSLYLALTGCLIYFFSLKGQRPFNYWGNLAVSMCGLISAATDIAACVTESAKILDYASIFMFSAWCGNVLLAIARLKAFQSMVHIPTKWLAATGVTYSIVIVFTAITTFFDALEPLFYVGISIVTAYVVVIEVSSKFLSLRAALTLHRQVITKSLKDDRARTVRRLTRLSVTYVVISVMSLSIMLSLMFVNVQAVAPSLSSLDTVLLTNLISVGVLITSWLTYSNTVEIVRITVDKQSFAVKSMQAQEKSSTAVVGDGAS